MERRSAGHRCCRAGPRSRMAVPTPALRPPAVRMLATSAELGDKRPGDGCEHHVVDGAACAMSGSDDVGQEARSRWRTGSASRWVGSATSFSIRRGRLGPSPSSRRPARPRRSLVGRVDATRIFSRASAASSRHCGGRCGNVRVGAGSQDQRAQPGCQTAKSVGEHVVEHQDGAAWPPSGSVTKHARQAAGRCRAAGRSTPPRRRAVACRHLA